MFTEPPPGYHSMILRPGARKIGLVFTYGPTPAGNVNKVIGIHIVKVFFTNPYIYNTRREAHLFSNC